MALEFAGLRISRRFSELATGQQAEKQLHDIRTVPPSGRFSSDFRLVKFATKVGPEFLGHIAHRIQHDVRAPDVERVA